MSKVPDQRIQGKLDYQRGIVQHIQLYCRFIHAQQMRDGETMQEAYPVWVERDLELIQSKIQDIFYLNEHLSDDELLALDG